MAKLAFGEMEILTRVLSMTQGYVLDFTNNSFSAFLKDLVGVDAYSGAYNRHGNSKAKILRAVFEDLRDEEAAVLIYALLEREKKAPNLDLYPLVTDDERNIANSVASRLSNEATDALPALTLHSVHEVFRRVRLEVEGHLKSKSYDTGLDRLHTFMTLYLRLVVTKAGREVPSNEVPLHSLMGMHVRNLSSKGRQLSEMTTRILRSSISTLESFNHIRNFHSFAHPTEQLAEKDEAEYIFSHVVALVCLLEKLETVASD